MLNQPIDQFMAQYPIRQILLKVNQSLGAHTWVMMVVLCVCVCVCLSVCLLPTSYYIENKILLGFLSHAYAQRAKFCSVIIIIVVIDINILTI